MNKLNKLVPEDLRVRQTEQEYRDESNQQGSLNDCCTQPSAHGIGGVEELYLQILCVKTLIQDAF